MSRPLSTLTPSAGPNTPVFVSVLEEDPDLGVGIAREDWQRAVQSALAPALNFEPGRWCFAPPPDHGVLGALVLSGMIVIQVDAGSRCHIELLGEGDIVSPWVTSGDDLTIPLVLNSLVVKHLRVAVLDRPFALRTARWPEIHAAVVRRVVVRTRRLSLQAAINAVPRVEDRLELTLWELAYRFGRVTREGIALELPLTHSQLADILGVHRPSVTLALGRLQSQERLVHAARHAWLLSGEPPPALELLARRTGLRA